jgi:hypothetical protein
MPLMPAVLKSVHATDASRVKERACQPFFNCDVYVEHTYDVTVELNLRDTR